MNDLEIKNNSVEVKYQVDMVNNIVDGYTSGKITGGEAQAIVTYLREVEAQLGINK